MKDKLFRERLVLLVLVVLISLLFLFGQLLAQRNIDRLFLIGLLFLIYFLSTNNNFYQHNFFELKILKLTPFILSIILFISTFINGRISLVLSSTLFVFGILNYSNKKNEYTRNYFRIGKLLFLLIPLLIDALLFLNSYNFHYHFAVLIIYLFFIFLIYKYLN